MRDRPGRREVGEPVHALRERGDIARIQPPRVDGVPRQQETGPRVEDRDRRGVVPGNPRYVKHAAAQVEPHHFGGPVGEAERLPHGVRLAPNQPGQRPSGELLVCRHMIAVTVGVRHDELVAGSRVVCQPRSHQPVDGRPEREDAGLPGGPGIEEHRTLITEKQIDERGLVVGRLSLAQHIRVRVIGVDLDRRLAGRTVIPAHVEVTGHRRAGGEVDVGHVSHPSHPRRVLAEPPDRPGREDDQPRDGVRDPTDI